jgi:hypothetical protein
MTNSLPSQFTTWKPRIPGWAFAFAGSFVLTVAVLLPFYWYGSASGHDFEFHAASWLDAAFQWKEGTLYPRWTAWTNYGFGEPRFIFYPPLSWMLGGALTRIVPGPCVPVIFILLTQSFAGLFSFFLLRRLAGEKAAILGALWYAINPNALLLTYIRSDFAEQLACAIFPLLLLAALYLAELLGDSRPNFSSIALFAFPFAAVWLSNAPAGVLASYSMALLFAWATFTERNWKIALRGAAGVTLGFGLAGVYLIPAVYEQRWVNIGQALSSGLLPVQNFLFTRIDDPEHTWFNWIASACALLLLLLFLVTALISRRFNSSANLDARARKLWTALLVVGSAASLLMLRITNPLWDLLPKLRFVQFPWRWMSIIALVCSCFLAAAFEKRRAWLLFVVILAISVPLSLSLINNGWWDTDEMPTQAAAITNGKGFDGTDEYDPLGDDHLDLPVNAPLVRLLAPSKDGPVKGEAGVQIVKWATEQKEIRVDAQSGARVALRLINYPAWRVQVNGKTVQPERMEDVNQMVIPVEVGRSIIQVRFMRTLDRLAGCVISLVSVLIAFVWLLAGRRVAKRNSNK